ncbi:hypothetical protein [Nostoc sp.]|uniref:hypothetical protein n=1 Tax=Nostoc sp. TaxID=1180 RepID=UPI002FF6C6B2
MAQPVVDIASQNLSKWIKYDNTAPQQKGYGDRHIVEEFLKCNFLQYRVDVVRPQERIQRLAEKLRRRSPHFSTRRSA